MHDVARLERDPTDLATRMIQSHITIKQRPIGPGAPCYVVAELSANHNQSLETALQLVAAAAAAGADAVKTQTYTADTITLNCDSDLFRIRGGPWDGRTLHDLYTEAHTPWDWVEQIHRKAEELGLACFSTPFDPSAVDFLEQLKVPAYKIASFELVDLPLIRRVAATGKPLVLSTGMADLDEIDAAVQTCLDTGNRQVVLLKCTSAYPARPEDMNLRAIPALQERYGGPVGLSDHTLGTTAATVAVALGAALVEKHLTLSRGNGGPDSSFSLEPDEFRQLVEVLRSAGRSLGKAQFTPSPGETHNRSFRRSLFVVAPIARGEILSRENIRSIRPGHGLAPKHLDEVLGRRASRDLSVGTPLTREMLL